MGGAGSTQELRMSPTTKAVLLAAVVALVVVGLYARGKLPKAITGAAA